MRACIIFSLSFRISLISVHPSHDRDGWIIALARVRTKKTEEELLTYYLAKKVASQRIDLDVICDIDLNKLEPWDIQGL